MCAYVEYTDVGSVGVGISRSQGWNSVIALAGNLPKERDELWKKQLVRSSGLVSTDRLARPGGKRASS